MSINFEPRVTCDNCKKEKKEVNHWYIIRLISDRKIDILSFNQFKYIHPKQSKDYFVCGLECLHQVLSSTIKEINMEEK